MSNAFFHKASLCNLLFLPIRELVRVRARTFCAKTVRDCSRTADFGLFVTFRLFSSTMLKERENCSLNAGHAGIAGGLCNGIGYRTDDLFVERHRHDILRVQLLIGNAGRDRLSRCQLHLLVDVACANIECAAENARERKHVVDLVRGSPNGRCRQRQRRPSLRPPARFRAPDLP